jgi:hypothetical protein
VPVVTAVLHGTAAWWAAAVLILWVVTLVAGLFVSLEGYRAAQWHRDPFNAGALAPPLGVGLLCLYALYAGWSLPLEWGAVLAACSRCALSAAVAYNAAGLWLQLRGPVALLFERQSGDPLFRGFENLFKPKPRPDPQSDYQWPDSQWREPDSGAAALLAELAEYREVADNLAHEVEQSRCALAERDRVITEIEAAGNRVIGEVVTERDGIAAERDGIAAERDYLAAKCDRYLTSGKMMAAERRDTETWLMLPGVERALVKALHPNAHGGKSAAELRAFNDGFVKLTALYQRLKAER